MVVTNYLLTGMILQAPGRSKFPIWALQTCKTLGSTNHVHGAHVAGNAVGGILVLGPVPQVRTTVISAKGEGWFQRG